MSTTVYAMGQWDGSGYRFNETLAVVAKDVVGGSTSNYVPGYGPEFLTDANQATFFRGYHGYGGGTTKDLELIPTITRDTIAGPATGTTSLMQSVVLVNVLCDVRSETSSLNISVEFYDASSASVGSYLMTRTMRSDGAADYVWSGDIPETAATALVAFAVAGLSSTSYVQIGQMMASFYSQAYTWPCTANNTINTRDSVTAERNIDQIQTIGGQRFDKFLFQRYIWSGELTTTDRTFMTNLQWWQQQPGIYLQSDEWGFRAPETTGLYGKLRLGSMADEVTDPTVYRVPFEFQENPA